jgi:regulator of sirC expression with transglutaminase-like and TPR domain
MLMNLQGIYVRGEAWDKALGVIDRLVLLDEDGARVHRRNRGAVLLKLGRPVAAAAEWEGYLGRYPEADDAADVRRELRAVRQALASRN